MGIVMLSNCGHDERGKWSGGVAGDQSGSEWHLIPWYYFGQNVVMRHPKIAVRDMLAELATDAALNDMIGYDQDQRLTFDAALGRVGWDPSAISEKCEADCSAGVASLVRAAGHRLGIGALQKVPATAYTGNLRHWLSSAGFESLTSSEFTRHPDLLDTGDILLNEERHVAIVTRGNLIPREPLIVDGHLGVYSVSEWQRALGTYVDGIVSGQWIENRQWIPRLESVDWSDTGDSPFARTLQAVIGADIDGYIGRRTVLAIQRWINARTDEALLEDGILGEYTAKAIQRALNAGLF